MSSCKPALTPLPQHINLTPDDGDLLQDPTAYRILIGKLNFLTNNHPDLDFTIQLLSQFMHSPRTSHISP